MLSEDVEDEDGDELADDDRDQLDVEVGIEEDEVIGRPVLPLPFWPNSWEALL